jgi:hypothetical protein
MKCPYCNEDMEQGYIQGGMAGAGTSLLWTKRLHKLLLKPKADEVLLAKNIWGYVTAETHFCRKCNKFIIDGDVLKK